MEDNPKKKNNYFFYFFRALPKYLKAHCNCLFPLYLSPQHGKHTHKLGGLLSDLLDLWLVITFLTLFVNPYIILRLVSFYLLTLQPKSSDIKWWTVFVQHTATRATSLLIWRFHCLQRLPPPYKDIDNQLINRYNAVENYIRRYHLAYYARCVTPFCV